MSKTIPLTKGYVTIVDDEDYEWLSRWSWHAAVTSSGDVYANRAHWNSESRKYHTVGIHRQILGLKKGDKRLADHINGDTLDNRRENLRIVDNSQSQMNRGTFSNSRSGHKGVWWHAPTKKWGARIKRDGKLRHLGTFETLEDALDARRRAEKELHGEYTRCKT